MVLSRQPRQQGPPSRLDAKLFRRKNYGACWNCRLRKKGGCEEPTPTGDCAACIRLRISCQRGYGRPVPPEFRMRNWSIRPVNRGRGTPLSLVVTSPAAASASAAGPSAIHQTTQNIPSIFIQPSSTPAPSFQDETAEQLFQAGGNSLGIFAASTRERSGSTSSSCSSVTTVSNSSQLSGEDFLAAGAFPPSDSLLNDITPSWYTDPSASTSPYPSEHLNPLSTGTAPHEHNVYQQPPADSPTYRDPPTSTHTPVTDDRALPGGSVHGPLTEQTGLPFLRALESILTGENQQWNNLWSDPMSLVNVYSLYPLRDLHVGGERTEWTTSEVNQNSAASLPAFLEPVQSSASLNYNAWAETVQSNERAGPAASGSQSSSATQRRPGTLPESVNLTRRTSQAAFQQALDWSAIPPLPGPAPCQSPHECPPELREQRMNSNSDRPTNSLGSIHSPWQIQRSPEQNQAGVWLPDPLEVDRRRHEIENRARYNAYLHASSAEDVDQPSLSPLAFVEHSAVGLNARAEANPNTLRVESGRPAQATYYAGQHWQTAQTGQETPRRTQSGDLPAVQADEAQYAQSLPPPPNTHPQPQPLDGVVFPYPDNSHPSDYAGQSYT